MKAREKILRLIRERGVTQAEVARAAGVAYSTFRTYLESDSPRSPSVDTAIRIAKFLKVSPGWLWDDSLGELDREPSSAQALGEEELIDELARRRRLVVQDMRRIAERFQDQRVLDRLEQIAARCHRDKRSLTHTEFDEYMAAIFDLERLGYLQSRLERLSPDRVYPVRSVPSWQEILANHPYLRRDVSHLQAEGRNERALLGHYESGNLQPIFGPLGEIIDRDQFIQQGAILQRQYVPIVDDLRNVPKEQPIMVHRGQLPPEEFRRFVRFTPEQPSTFAFEIKDHGWEPIIPAHSVIICAPGEPDRTGRVPSAVLFRNRKRQGIFLVLGDKLVSPNPRKKPIMLKDRDNVIFFPMIAGPFGNQDRS